MRYSGPKRTSDRIRVFQLCAGLALVGFTIVMFARVEPAGTAEFAQARPSAGQEREITPAQLEQYVSVYRAMQKDRRLTVERAAKEAGLTLAQFRELEGRIERDDRLRERARRALREQATPESTPTPTGE